METIVFTHAFIVRFFSRLVHLKMPIDKKRYAVAAFAIATAAIIEEEIYAKTNVKHEESGQKNGCLGVLKSGYTTVSHLSCG